MTPLYVYAVTEAGHPLDLAQLTGVGGGEPAVRAVREDMVCAVVSDAVGQLRAKRRDVMAHQEVVSALWRQGPVLPMRFGVLAPDEAAVRTDLTAQAHVYLHRLKDLGRAAEFHLKAVHQEEPALREVLEADTPLAERSRQVTLLPRQDQIAFGEAVAGRLRMRQQQHAERVQAALVPLSQEQAQGEPGGEVFFSCSYLVAPEHADAFRDAARTLSRQLGHGVELRLSDPLPPYSFVQERGWA
jgi:hypothetical protein